MRLNEVNNIYMYKFNVYNILKIWDLKLIVKYQFDLFLFILSYCFIL